MLHIALLILSIAPVEFPSLIIPPAYVGLVPTLAPPPDDLPIALDRPDGGVYLPPLRAQYVAMQISVLYNLPWLSQKALDQAVAAERDQCAIMLADERASRPSKMSTLRTNALWAGLGVLAGAVLIALVPLF
jgi:hypothetical protein